MGFRDTACCAAALGVVVSLEGGLHALGAFRPKCLQSFPGREDASMLPGPPNHVLLATHMGVSENNWYLILGSL